MASVSRCTSMEMGEQCSQFDAIGGLHLTELHYFPADAETLMCCPSWGQVCCPKHHVGVQGQITPRNHSQNLSKRFLKQIISAAPRSSSSASQTLISLRDPKIHPTAPLCEHFQQLESKGVRWGRSSSCFCPNSEPPLLEEKERSKRFSGGKSGATALWTEVLLSSFLHLPHANYSCNEDILLEKILAFIYNKGNLLPATSWCASNTKEEQGACRSQSRQQIESSCHWIVLGRFGPSVLPFGVSIRCISPAANLQLGKQRHRVTWPTPSRERGQSETQVAADSSAHTQTHKALQPE